MKIEIEKIADGLMENIVYISKDWKAEFSSEEVSGVFDKARDLENAFEGAIRKATKLRLSSVYTNFETGGDDDLFVIGPKGLDKVEDVGELILSSGSFEIPGRDRECPETKFHFDGTTLWVQFTGQGKGKLWDSINGKWFDAAEFREKVEGFLFEPGNQDVEIVRG